MSKVALRVYNREIETLIDQGHIEEAIAHCQHILKFYPKHLETYRLLGKAYLEVQRHTDAADIFQRILVAVPDDFVSQLGMSIVRDEQKDLDGAIWHMERAFEVNPSNAGVQGELRRLYGRRDGLEPPKIRLTRGALAQMYTKGGQYQQAIAEIKSVLAEDSTRVDMKILMARAFYRAGQKVEATEICTDLLKQFPYCLDANRILVEILPGTSMAQSLDTYKKRVQALDPYAALATASIFDIDSVPDNTVVVERLEWEPGAAPQDSFSGASNQSTEGIPDFLRTSGWGPSTGEFQDGPMDFSTDEPAAPAGLAAAEIPDWLKAMAPPGSSAGQEDASAAGGDLASEDLDWLSGLGGPVSDSQTPAGDAHIPASDDNQPDWLKGMGDSASVDQAPGESQPQAASDDQLDWMKDMGIIAATGATGVAASQAADDNLDWLQNLGGPQETASPEPVAPVSDAPIDTTTQPAPADDIDWLQNLGGPQETASPEPVAPVSDAPIDTTTQPAPADDMDWLQNLGGPQETALAEPVAPVSDAPADTTQPAPADDMDWLQNLGGPQETASPEPVAPIETTPVAAIPSQPEPEAKVRKDLSDDDDIPPLTAPISGPGTSESEQDDAMKWLESLAQKQGAKPEEMITQPHERTEAAPDWVGRVDAAPDQPAADQTLVQPPAAAAPEPKRVMAQDDPNFVPGPLSALVAGPGTSASEQDDAMKWLESLAQNQGAKPEEMITQPHERTEAAPDWVGRVDSVPDQPAADQTLVQPPAAAAPEPKRVMAQDDPNFVPGPLSALVAGPGTSASEQDDAMKWLESLAQNQGAKPEEMITQPHERTEAVPDWVGRVDAAPDQPAADQTLVQPPAAAAPEPKRVMAQDDPNFVPGPLSALVAGPGTSASEQDDAMKWLESLAQNQGAKPEEMITQPHERTEAAPDWVGRVDSAPDQPAADPTLVQPPAAAAPEQDDSMKWLEGLAEPQDAGPEEPVINPGGRADDVPGWITQASLEPVLPPAETPPTAFQLAPAAQEDDTLDWLQGLAANEQENQPAAEPVIEPTPVAQEVPSAPAAEAQPAGDISEWLKNLDAEDQSQPASTSTPATAPADELPEWLNTEQPNQASQDDLPEWLKDQSADEQSPTPAPASAWIPDDSSVAAPLIFSPPLEIPAPAAIETPASTSAPTVPAPPLFVEPPTVVRPAVRQTGMLGDKDGPALQNARESLAHGSMDSAINTYTKLIKRGKLLEEIVYDLKEATYTHPVDVIVWQTLGDAHMRSNQLQEALDAYTKAEELLR